MSCVARQQCARSHIDNADIDKYKRRPLLLLYLDRYGTAWLSCIEAALQEHRLWEPAAGRCRILRARLYQQEVFFHR